MKLDILDAYNIRARLSPSIILLGPIAFTLFFCFEDLYNLASSTILICILLAFTNYIPILQRYINQERDPRINYAAKCLELNDPTITLITKKRYYAKLAKLDDSFLLFNTPSDSQEFKSCCESAVTYLRNQTRDNHLVMEENINCGFCKNMLLNKPIGILINIALGIITALYSLHISDSLSLIPMRNWAAFLFNLLYLIFWVFGINKKMLRHASLRYAVTLISAIDTLKDPDAIKE